MNSQTTYTLLARSREPSRDLLEAAIYAMCILSAIMAIWQFIDQSSRISVHGLALRTQPVSIVSQQAADRNVDLDS